MANDRIRRLASDPTESVLQDDRVRILQAVARASFSSVTRRVSEWARMGIKPLGEPRPSDPNAQICDDTEMDAAEWHAAKHIAQGEWEKGTSTKEYLDDIGAAALDSAANLCVGMRVTTYPDSQHQKTAPAAAVTTATMAPGLALKKAIPSPDLSLLTIYSADNKKILTCFRLRHADAQKKTANWTNRRDIK